MGPLRSTCARLLQSSQFLGSAEIEKTVKPAKSFRPIPLEEIPFPAQTAGTESIPFYLRQDSAMRYKIFWFAVLLCVTAEFSSAMAQTPPNPDASPTFMERLNRWGSKIFGTRSSNDPTPKPAMPSPDSNYVVLPPNALPPENIVPGVPPAPTNMPVMADPNGQIPVPPAPSLDERLPPKYVSPDPSTAQNPTQDGSVDNPAVEPMQSRLSRFRQSILEKNDPPPSNSTPVNAPAGNAVPADPTIITPYGPGSVNSPPILSEPKRLV